MLLLLILKRNGHVVFVGVKLDMSKASDRIYFSYIEGLIRTIGFPDRFFGLIMKCVLTVSFSLMLNGRRCGEIILERGIRQGIPCPFTYLFFVLNGFHAC